MASTNTRTMRQTPEKGEPSVALDTLSFGVEIETHLPRTPREGNQPVEIGGYHRGRVQRDMHAPRGCAFGSGYWKAEYDSSIVLPNSNRVACEWVSPPLKANGIAMEFLKHSVELIKSKDAKINSSCGVHVHVSFPSNDLRALQRLAHLMSSFENGLYAATGTKRREQGRWCRKINDRWRNVDFKKPSIEAFRQDYTNNYIAASERYTGLNLTNLLSTNKPDTVEFRLFSASLNPKKICAYVQLCLALVQTALVQKKASRWNGKPATAAHWGNGGPGLKELNRMLFKLCWIRGNYRDYGAMGIVPDGPYTIKEMVKELRRLAKKYDDPNT